MTQDERLKRDKASLKRKTDQNIALKIASDGERTSYSKKAHQTLMTPPWYLRGSHE